MDEELTTNMPDFRPGGLARVREEDGEEFQEATRVMLDQVAKPRANLGGGGPPGRAD